MHEPRAKNPHPGNLYFDNAATTWPKPETVYRALSEQLRSGAGNPGRSGHTGSLEGERLIYRTRAALADFFGAPDPSRIVFAFNATDALNIAIKGFLHPGDHVLCTAMDHNSVLRPLGAFRRENLVKSTVVPANSEGHIDLAFLEQAYLPETRLLIINHASNVTGTIAPLAEMISSAHARGVAVLVDAAQTAGCVPLNVMEQKIDMLAFTGHKGLLGPPGTGGLYVRQGLDLRPLREGGTGSHSETDLQPEEMPDRLEAGTHNTPGLAGLLAGVAYITEHGLDNIRAHEMEIRRYLVGALREIPGLTVYGPVDSDQCVSVISIELGEADNGTVGFALEDSYGIISRTGLHCAPLAHQAIGTYPRGTLRLSPGYFTTPNDAGRLVKAMEETAVLAR